MFSKYRTAKIEPVLILLLFIQVAFVATLFPGHPWDVHCWEEWAKQVYQHGLINAYGAEPDNNYPPLFQYFLYFYTSSQGSIEEVGQHISYLRSIGLLFDFLGIWFVYKWIDKKISYLLLLLLCILNLGFSYNTVIWGQFDGILAACVFISLYFGYRQKMVLSSIFFMLALNIKLQAIVFLPIFGVLWLFNLLLKKNWKIVALPIAAMLLLQAAILLPFMTKPGGLQEVWNVVMNAVGYFPKVSMNAFNIWYLVGTGDPFHTPDSGIFIAGLTYKTAGFIMFFTASFLVLLPILKLLYRRFKGEEVWPSRELIWLTGALIAMIFYYLNTQMHERYVHPAIIFLTAYAVYTRNWVAYALFSLTYYLSLQKVLKGLEVDPKILAVLFGIVMVLLSVHLIRLAPAKALDHATDADKQQE